MAAHGTTRNRILKGQNPGVLPVQLPTKYDLVINLKTAKMAEPRGGAIRRRQGC
jgi:hypothetical protein